MDQTEQKPDRNATKSEIWNRSRPTTLNKPRKREAVNNLKRKRKKRGVCWRREGVVVITKWWKQRKGDVKNERRGRWSWKKLWGRFSHICRRKSKKGRLSIISQASRTDLFFVFFCGAYENLLLFCFLYSFLKFSFIFSFNLIKM